MATKVHMEALSPTMEEGQVVKWLKAEGDEVASGDVLAEVETDKATMELVARGDGVLRAIFLHEGGTAPVGDVIGVIADHSGVAMDEIGTTTFRPPYTPVDFGAVSGTRDGPVFLPYRHTPITQWNKDNGAVMYEAGARWRRPAGDWGTSVSAGRSWRRWRTSTPRTPSVERWEAAGWTQSWRID